MLVALSENILDAAEVPKLAFFYHLYSVYYNTLRWCTFLGNVSVAVATVVKHFLEFNIIMYTQG